MIYVRSIWNLLLFLVLLSLFIFLPAIIIVFSISSRFYLVSSPTHRTKSSHSNTYQYAGINLRSSITKYGTLQIPQTIQREEYITYTNKETNSESIFIVSNFGGAEYQCTGTCSCKEDSRRSFPITTILTRNLLVLISALSTSMAFQIAKDVFREDCALQFSDSCDMPNLIADVNDCSPVSSSKDDFQSFVCYGHCVEFEDLVHAPSHIHDEGVSLYGSCDSLELMEEVILNELDETKDESLFEWTRLVKIVFSVHYLHPFCVKSTGIETNQEMANEEWWKHIVDLEKERCEHKNEFCGSDEEDVKEQKNMFRVMEKGFPFCVGHNFDTSNLENIHCVPRRQQDVKFVN